MRPGKGRFRLSASRCRRITAVVVLAASIGGCGGARPAQVTANPVNVSGQVKTEPVRDPLDYVQIAVPAIAFLTAGLIWLQLRSASATARRERANALAQTWADRDFRKLVSPTLAFLQVGGDMSKCLARLRDWIDAPRAEERCLRVYPELIWTRTPANVRKNDVLHVLGAIEDVAIQYNERQADQKAIALMLGPHLIRFLQQGLWLVAFLARDSPTTYSEWIRAVGDLRHDPRADAHFYEHIGERWRKRWQKGRRVNVKELTADLPDQTLRAVCIPPKGASTRDWSLAGDLSPLLSAPELQPHLPAATAIPPGTDLDSVWRVVVVPRSLDDAARAVRETNDPTRARLQAFRRGVLGVVIGLTALASGYLILADPRGSTLFVTHLSIGVLTLIGFLAGLLAPSVAAGAGRDRTLASDLTGRLWSLNSAQIKSLINDLRATEQNADEAAA